MSKKESKIVNNGIHGYSAADAYVPPREPAVREHLKWFMGLKLGLMMHWAPGCQLGTYESWPLSDGDGHWSQADADWTDIETFKQEYIDCNKTFNPVKFRPDRMAEFAKECGFKYLLFTTKHHDGFCMYDTRTTDYKITDASCPFHTHPDADITGALYREFKKQGLAISVYFSKPDWHSDAYWHKAFGTAPSRNVNYSINEHPELWEEFVSYTHDQLRELTSDYGKVDVLWLDGGWVRKDQTGQDIRLDEIITEIRGTTQPHLIVCDRTVGGEYENIITPEKEVPDAPLFVPWETCTTVGEKFSFHYTDHFKSGLQLVHLLLDVVSKGGNLALNLAPQPDGLLPAPAMASLKDMGRWLAVHGDGIYGTEITAPYYENQIKYTAGDGRIYAFYLYDEVPSLPSRLYLHLTELSGRVSAVTVMRTGAGVEYKEEFGSLVLKLSDGLSGGGFYAECFVIQVEH